MSFPVPEKVLALSAAIRDAGGRALLVGGCVRDTLMGQEPKDWDLEVYGVDPARLRTLLDQFGPVNVVGEAFTVYKLGLNSMFRCLAGSESLVVAIVPLSLKETLL